MATAGDIADRALKRILVEASESPLEADDYADFFGSMNAMMAAWEAEGLRMGYTPVDNVSDEMTVPDACLRGIVANMAIEVASDYDAPVSQSLAREASNGLKAIRHLCVDVGQVSRPSTLPFGSGNRTTFYREPEFYGQKATALISIQNNTDATTVLGGFDFVKAKGFWNIERYEGIQPDITGRLTNTLDEMVRVRVKATINLKADVSTLAGISLYRNSQGGVLAASGNISSTPAEIIADGSVDLYPGEYIELYVTDFSATNPITVVSGRIDVGATVVT